MDSGVNIFADDDLNIMRQLFESIFSERYPVETFDSAAHCLEGAVRASVRDFERTLSKSGENWPQEIAVIDNVRALDRIFEFKDRAAFNPGHVTILATNTPDDNPEQGDLIRDNFAIAAESADAKLSALHSIAAPNARCASSTTGWPPSPISA